MSGDGFVMSDANRSKEQQTFESLAASKEAKAGDLIYTGPKTRVPMPDMPAGQKAPCGAHLRDGFYCKFGPTCKFDHTPIDKLDPEIQKIWFDHVAATDGLIFNLERVKCGIESINYGLARKDSKPKGKAKEEDSKPAAKPTK